MFFQRHLEICQNIYQGNNEYLAESFKNLGLLYYKMDLFEKSQENFKKSLNVYEKLPEEFNQDKCEVIEKLHNLYKMKKEKEKIKETNIQFVENLGKIFEFQENSDKKKKIKKNSLNNQIKEQLPLEKNSLSNVNQCEIIDKPSKQNKQKKIQKNDKNKKNQKNHKIDNNENYILDNQNLKELNLTQKVNSSEASYEVINKPSIDQMQGKSKEIIKKLDKKQNKTITLFKFK